MQLSPSFSSYSASSPRRVPRPGALFRGRWPARLLAALVVAWLAVPLTAQRESFRDTTDVVVVEVPITVTDDGQPVRGLQAEDFEIRFDGDEQEIRSFEMIDLGPPTSGPIGDPVTPPIPARRHFLVLFDLANSDPTSIVRAREAGRDLVRSLHPSDLVGVALYDNIQGVRFILSFTTDRRQVDVALESLGLPGLFNPIADPLQLYLGEGTGAEARQVPPPGSPEESGGRAAGLASEAEQQIRDLVTAAAQLDRFESESRVKRLADGFQAMAKGLAGIEGQKYVIYMSEGFDSRLLLGSGTDTQATSSAIESGEIWNVNAEERYGDTGLQNEMARMLESLRRAGATVQAVDIGGLRAPQDIGSRPDSTDVLNSIAQDTGGELYDNFNNLGDAMDLMLDATSVTYLVTFQPKALPMDGKYRKLKVKLKNGPRGAKVSHRAGFYAPEPFEETTGLDKQLSSAQLILSDEDTGRIDLDVLAPAIPVAGQKTYVPLLLEMDGESLMEATGNRQQLQLQLFTYAFDTEGNIHDFFTEVVAMDLGQVGQGLREGGLKYWAHVDLEPGDYRVRVLVRDLASGEYGVRSADVTVTEGGTSLLPVMTADAPGAWIMARESASRQRDVPFPFLAGGQPFIPSATLSLPPSGKTDVILQMYGLESGADASARLVDLDGRPVDAEAELKVARLEQVGTATVGQGTLKTKGLDPGVYELVLTAPGAEESRIRVEVQ